VHPEDGGSVLDFDLCYNPPGGVLGDLLAALLGASLRHCLRDVLPRIQRVLGGAGGEAGSLGDAAAREASATGAESSQEKGRSRAPSARVRGARPPRSVAPLSVTPPQEPAPPSKARGELQRPRFAGHDARRSGAPLATGDVTGAIRGATVDGGGGLRVVNRLR